MHTLVGFDLDPTAHQLATQRLTAAGAAVVPVAVSSAGLVSFEQQQAMGTGHSSSQNGATAAPTAFLVRSNFGRMRQVLQQLPLSGPGSSTAGESNSGGNGRAAPGDGLAGGSGGVADGDGQVDAILLDLGISSMQASTRTKGAWQACLARAFGYPFLAWLRRRLP
jgi:hypothetical protein